MIRALQFICPFITLAGGVLLLIGMSHDSDLAALAFIIGLALAILGPILYLASILLSLNKKGKSSAHNQ